MSGTEHGTHSPAAAAPGNAQHAPAYKGPEIDEQVIDDFFNWPPVMEDTLNRPRLIGLLYGLLCVDISGREVLLPNPHGIAYPEDYAPYADHADHSDHGDQANHGMHRARIWFLYNAVSQGEDYEKLVVPDTDIPSKDHVYAYFDITDSRVEFAAVDAKGYPLPDPPANLAVRNNDQHPWMNFKWVRCLKKLTGRELITGDQRNDRDLVSARIRLETGEVAAIPPFSRDGQLSVWHVKQHDDEEVVSATTDSMLWSRPLPHGAKVRMTITPLAGGSPRSVLLSPENGLLMFAATHATTEKKQIATKLVHSRAFAKLLQGGDPRTFQVPVLAGNQRSLSLQSSEEVHCECASCP